jgi:8-oxo-dGTP pyrophosphatase MutT (NUDIX family)
MHLVFSDHLLPIAVTKSLFLAGPSPRKSGADDDYHDWRHEAVAHLKARGYDGTVFIPAPSAVFHGRAYADDVSYDNQIAWEKQARSMADQLVFWVPRIIDRTRKDLGMPGMTTNVEFGADKSSGKLAYGRPASAPKCRYLDECAIDHDYTVYDTLEATLDAAMASVGDGAVRTGGEVQVPLFIWRTPQFQTWYANLKAAGNVLHGAEVLFNAKVGAGVVFSYVLAVRIWVTAESRFKSNEMVFARRDIGVVLAYHDDPAANTAKIVLVREFRSTVNNPTGYVYELPGGSAMDSAEPMPDVARNELHEETGLAVVDAQRFRYIGKRQLAASAMAHQAHVYSIQLTADELAQLEAAAASSEAFGDTAGTERTFVHVVRIQDIFKLPVDYSTLGIIFDAMASDHAFQAALV